MQSPQAFEVVLLALLVGATLPILVQLFAVLRTARRVLESSGPRLDRALDEVTRAAARMSAPTASESGAATIGALLGPALVAGARAFRNGVGDHHPDHHPVDREGRRHEKEDAP